MKRVLAIGLLSLGAVACTESPQTATGVRSDTPAFNGTNMPYVAGGWKQGDRTSWEQQLKVRTQQGQNDYAKVN